MPELPEVETTVRDLKPQLMGRTIVGATVRWRRTIAVPSAREFASQIRGCVIHNITRRGKFLVFLLRGSPSARYLLVHLRMTGGFRIDLRGTPRDKHTRVLFELDDGRELRFRDPRKFGRMWLVDDPARVVGALGPEPLEISAREFARLFDGRRGRLKPLLMNQAFLAGLGNIYADEALWYARLHPLRAAESLTHAERGRLYRAIQRVLKRALALGGTSIDVMYKRVNGVSGGFLPSVRRSYATKTTARRRGERLGQDSLRAFDREPRPCRRCGTPIQKIVVAQRGTHYCPTCQRV